MFSVICWRDWMHCIDRKGNKVFVRDVPTGVIGVLYGFAAGRLLLRGLIWPGMSDLVGHFLDTKLSRVLNKSYIRRYGIDMSDYETGPFRSFNELFHRSALPGARPVDGDAEVCVSPCDGKLQVFSIDEGACFEIKGICYTMERLLRDPGLAERYRGGTLMLFRLGVDDYHRYAYPVDGTEGERVHLDGVLHTVTPVAAERRPIYCENIREYSLIRTPEFGTVLMMEVGALLVGRIRNSHPVGPVQRGEEKGWFEFGASSILLCFEKGRMQPDADLRKNTENGYETLVKLGERIGCMPPPGEN